MSKPYYGDEFTFTHPDGRQIEVRGWGDQYYAVFETLDGFTVVRDPVTGFYQYATVSGDNEELDTSPSFGGSNGRESSCNSSEPANRIRGGRIGSESAG